MKASELAEILNAQLVGEDRDISFVCSIENIREGGIVPLLGKDIPPAIFESDAVTFLAKKGTETKEGCTYILADDAELGLVSMVNVLHPPKKSDDGVNPNAYIADSAILHENVTIDSFASIGKRAQVGEGTHIYPSVVIGEDVVIGDDCIIYPNVTIYDGCKLGDRVIIHSGSVIGADGFGYYQKQGRNVKIPHIGAVRLENDVEIGANSCIDRGKFDDTVIGEGSKIDNQVQVAHNVILGKHCIMAGQSAIAGSSVLGDYVMMGARSGVIDHVNVCSKVMLAGGCGVMSNIEKPGIYGGSPSTTRKAWMREVALVRDLPNIVKRINELENEKDD